MDQDTIKELNELMKQGLYDDIVETMNEQFPLYSIAYFRQFQKFVIIIPCECDGVSYDDDDTAVFRMTYQEKGGFVASIDWYLNYEIKTSPLVTPEGKANLLVVKQCKNFIEAVQCIQNIDIDGEKALEEI